MIARQRFEYENTHLKRALKQRHSFPNIICFAERRRYEQLDPNETYEKRSKPPLYGAARCRMTLDCHSNLSC